MQTRIWSVLTLLVAAVVADLNCTQFVPKGSKGNVGYINFSGSSGSLDVDPVNARATNPVVLAYTHSGTPLHFQTCNSTSLNKTSFILNDPISGCDDAGCHNYYFNYVRIIDPRSGECLTSRALPTYSTVFELGPQKCNSNPTDASQLFLTSQEVSTYYDVGSKKFYSSVYLYTNDALGPTPRINSSAYGYNIYPYNSWFIAPDDDETVLYRSHDTSETSLIAVINI